MTRIAYVVAVVLLTGCASSPFVTDPGKQPTAARLIYTGEAPLGSGDGILGVDGHSSPNPASLYLLPGRHTVEFNCPGFMPIDCTPSAAFQIDPSVSYGFYCDGPNLRLKQQ